MTVFLLLIVSNGVLIAKITAQKNETSDHERVFFILMKYQISTIKVKLLVSYQASRGTLEFSGNI